MSLFFGGEKRSFGWSGMDGAPSGRRVSTRQATYLAPVFSAIRHLVDFAATLPVDGYRKNVDGSRTAMPLLPPLLRAPDQPLFQGLDQWVGQAMYGLVTSGNSVGWIMSTDGFGYPSDVRWLKRTDWSYDEMTSQWYVGGRPALASQLLHIPWIVPEGCTLGLSPLEHAMAMIRAGLSAQEYADIKRGGGLPPAHLKNNRMKLDPDQSERIRRLAVKSFASGDPFVTGLDWDLSVTQIPPNQAQFVETMKLSANQIAAIYGIDAREIGGEPAGSLTYSTDESRSLNRANNCRPYIVRLENAINRVLPQAQFIKFNVDATIRTDIKTRTDVVGEQVADGRLSVNEARALEDRAPVPGGDFYNVPRAQEPAVPAQRTGERP